MDIDTFWSLIETTKAESSGDIAIQRDLLIERLKELSEEEIVAFEDIYAQMETQAYRGELWDVAYIVHCGCTEEGFTDFRAWLIAQGRDVYQKVIEDPQNLADVIDEHQREDILFETFAYAASRAYYRKTGRVIYELRHPNKTYEFPKFGEMSDGSDEEIRAKFPRIAEKFRDCDEWFDYHWFSKPDDNELPSNP